MTHARYTVSRHGDHYDLFLEENGSLATWRLSAPPESGEARAEKIADHRMVYLDYEGPISNDRGSVTIHSQGTYEWHGDQLCLEGGSSSGQYSLSENTLKEK